MSRFAKYGGRFAAESQGAMAERIIREREAALEVVTRAEYDKMRPYRQGYTHYRERYRERSEVRGLENPYPKGSDENAEWECGEYRAVRELLREVMDVYVTL